MRLTRFAPIDLISRYRQLADLVEPIEMSPVILADPDDDDVLACAVAAEADYIVSGDRDLLSLGSFRGIPIVTPAEMTGLLESGL
jgi:predicted nucleic acid-binding protein